MKPFRLMIMFLLAVFVLTSSPVFGQRRVRSFGEEPQKEDANGNEKKASKSKLKSFDELTKDMVKVEGLFNFYHDTTENSYLMAIAPEHFDQVYLFAAARATGDGAFYDTGPLSGSFPFYFKRVGEKILMLEKNLRVRADTANVMYNAVNSGISDHLFASLEIKSKPEKDSKAVLVEPNDLFLRDISNTDYYLGQRAKTGVRFDSKNSYFEFVKSFPQNSEIAVKLHFASSRPNSGEMLQNGDSFYHTYRFSMSAIPESDYVPRYMDDRVGYFATMFLDYDNLDRESPYVRYIDRWHLKKKEPKARLSEPVKPIVYWIENTVPEEYRPAIAEGIEFWNMSFEKIGFKNAIQAKEMPDTADWDPLDVRYSTIRWMVSPRVYAIGPHRANPFTGEVYDADISVSVDFIRAMFNQTANYVKPIAYDGTSLEEEPVFNPGSEHDHDGIACTYGQELAQEAAFALTAVLARTDDLEDKDHITKKFVHEYLVELIAHEVGHTLGFRHNFKASSIYSLKDINNPDFTQKYSTLGTVMDYAPPNIAPKGAEQGDYFATIPGPYDDWLIEYGYSDLGSNSPDYEKEKLDKIASRAGEKELTFGTDFDLSGYSVDPRVNTFDMGSDPLAYAEHGVKLTNELWDGAISKFEESGESYEKIRRVFGYGWRAYRQAAVIARKYVGGLYHSTNYIGDPGGDIPFRPVPAMEQRRAMQFMRDYIFGPNALTIDDKLLNRLQPPRAGEFGGSIYSSPIAYPYHQQVLNVQNYALNYLYSPVTLARVVDNSDRWADGDEQYNIYEVFTDIRRAIWAEIVNPDNVTSLRRQLQIRHLSWITGIYLSHPAQFPTDARTLAANDLDILEAAAKKAIGASGINDMSRAHYKEVLRQIDAAKTAEREYTSLSRALDED